MGFIIFNNPQIMFMAFGNIPAILIYLQYNNN